MDELRGSNTVQNLIDHWHEYRSYTLVLLGLAVILSTAVRWQTRKSGVKPRDALIAASNSSASSPKDNLISTKAGGETQPSKVHTTWVDRDTPIQPFIGRKQSQAPPRRVIGSKKAAKAGISAIGGERNGVTLAPYIFYSSITGSTETYAKAVQESLKTGSLKDNSRVLEAKLLDISYLDYDDYFVTAPKISENKEAQPFYLILVPTYNIDTVLNNFLGHLDETHHDFRIDTAPLSGVAGYSVFGFGDREGWPTEAEGFCSQAREVDKWLAKLTGRKRAFPLGMGDTKTDAEQRLGEWQNGVEESIAMIAKEGTLGEGVIGSGDPLESDEEEQEAQDEVEGETRKQPQSKPRKKARKGPTDIGDLEDLGKQLSGTTDLTAPIDFTNSSPSAKAILNEPKAMVPKSSPTYASLTKQGYTIVGTHSGVKICRWTKSALRGRGSCYKHSFYGIASHLCMETTPSLSCSNKCVFCWRHGTNPVGTTWRWQVDSPQLIFDGAKAGHYQKIKMLRGVPGVRAERFQEAQRIRHCALSLVGEPIFYPHINEFLDLLHGERISSFLVCNAQHPDHLARLKQVTQLYVSIDASNKEELRRVDRPLHRDFWERFQRCLDILRAQKDRMRTVFRLTLVKRFNLDEEAEGYAELVARGLPCFVEIKGVTFCGTSTSASAGITMQNVPFWHEVQAFVLALNAALERRGLDYGIAAEHAHSCCALIASTRFRIEGRWHTLIDYDRFFELLEAGAEFGPEDYIGAPTPEWAHWGNGGFDPSDVRVDRKGRKIEAA